MKGATEIRAGRGKKWANKGQAERGTGGGARWWATAREYGYWFSMDELLSRFFSPLLTVTQTKLIHRLAGPAANFEPGYEALIDSTRNGRATISFRVPRIRCYGGCSWIIFFGNEDFISSPRRWFSGSWSAWRFRDGFLGKLGLLRGGLLRKMTLQMRPLSRVNGTDEIVHAS